MSVTVANAIEITHPLSEDDLQEVERCVREWKYGTEERIRYGVSVQLMSSIWCSRQIDDGVPFVTCRERLRMKNHDGGKDFQVGPYFVDSKGTQTDKYGMTLEEGIKKLHLTVKGTYGATFPSDRYLMHLTVNGRTFFVGWATREMVIEHYNKGTGKSDVPIYKLNTPASFFQDILGAQNDQQS